MKKKKRAGSPAARPFYQEGGIHINPEHEGAFTAFAQQMRMSVQEAAAHVLANKEKFSPERVKQANFARNAAGWRKQEGGGVSLEPGAGSREPDGTVGSPEGQDGYAKNTFFNRLFNRNNILEEQIRDEYKALKQIPLRKMHVDYASGEDAATMAQLHHNPEYIGPGTGLRDRQIGNVLVPKGKLLANVLAVDDSAYVPPIVDDPRFVTVRYPGHYTTLINPAGLSKEKIKSLAANDFVSHGLKDDPVYNGMSEELLRLLIDRYGDEDVRNNGGVDAYVRGLISDDPEYDVYRKEMDFVPQALKDKIVNYVRSGKKSLGGPVLQGPGKRLVRKKQEGGGVDVQHPFGNGYMPAVSPASPAPAPPPAAKPREAPPQFTPFFTTPEQYKEYQKLFQTVSSEALGPEDDLRYLKYTPYHKYSPDPNSKTMGFDCINGTCGLDEQAGLHWSHPPDPDVKRYLSNKDFLKNIREGKEDYLELNTLPDFDGMLYPGDHFILLNKEKNDPHYKYNEPHHSMKVMDMERDAKGKPWRIRFIENDGNTKFHNQTTMTMDEFWDRMYRGDEGEQKFRKNDLIVLRPGKYLAEHMTKEQKAQQAAEELQAQAKARQNFIADNPMGRPTWSLWDTYQEGGVYRRESIGGSPERPLAGTPTVGGGRELKAGKGGVSREGYKADSPDRFNAFNIIPSNQITMQGVPHPVMGVDDLGHQQLMLPGYQYVFPGSYVIERPLAALGGQQLKTYGKGGSFANAFAEARKTLGAGHTFEWNGKTYTTNVAGETGLVDAPAKPLPPVAPPQEYRNWEEIKAERERQNALSDEGRIVSTYENTEDPYLIVDKKNALLKLYHGPSLVKQYEVGVGANPGDAQTVTKLRNGHADWTAGNMSTGAGVYTISNKLAHNKDYFNAPSFNMVNDQGVEVATSLHGTPVARRWRFDNGNVEDNRMSNGCINGKCYDLEDLYHNQQLPVGAKVYVLPEDAGNQFQVVDGKPVLRVAPKNAANYNSYTDSRGRVQKGQGVNRTTQTLVYQPIRTILDKAAFQKDVYQWDDFNDENEYQNTTRPFVNGLVQNKQKIMQAAQIPSDVYNDIVKVAFGIYGTESNFGDTHSALGNFARAANKFVSPGSSSSPDVQAKFNTYGADDATNSVGYTQIRWGQLNDDEKKALAKVGITSNRDFLNPEKAAIGTATILGVRYNQQLTPEQKKDILTYLPTKWNTRANYSDRVKQNSRYLKVEQMENPGGGGPLAGTPTVGGSRGLRRAQQGGTMGVIPPFTLETRMHEPKTMDSMLPADSPVFQQKHTLDATIQQREILSRTPAQQAAYERGIEAKRIAEENRKEWLRQQELDRRAKAMEQSDEVQDNTSFFSSDRWSRQNLATIAQAIPERGRLFPESVGGAGQFFDDYINPLVWVGNLAKGLGESPLEAQQTNSVMPYLRAFGTPLAAGALGINPVTTVTDPLKGVFTAKGLTGQVNNVWKNVVKSNSISTVKDKAIEAAKDTYLPLPQRDTANTMTPIPTPAPAPAPTPTPAPPAPTPAPADRSSTDFSGTSLYDSQGRIVGMYQFKKDSNPGTNPGQQLAELMFVKNNGAVDTARGRYEIPAGKFTNQMIGGVSTLKDTTGLSQYRVPLTGGSSYEAGGGVSRDSGAGSQQSAFGGKGLRIAAEGSEPKPVDQTEVQRQEVLLDLLSPMYKKRLQEELGREDVQDELDARINNVVNAKVVYNEGMPYPEYGVYVPKQPIGEMLASTPGWKLQATVPYKPTGLRYDTGWRPRGSVADPYNRNVPGTVYLEDVFKRGKKAPLEASNTPWHEFWHVAIDGGARAPYSSYDLVHNLTDPGLSPLIYRTNGFESSYLTDFPEVYSRKKTTEKLLRENSIYDSRTQKFDDAAYRKMRSNPEIQKNSDYQELDKSIKGEGDEHMNNFIKLMNGMASRSNGTGSTMARYGGRVSRKSYEFPFGAGDSSGKYQDGGQSSDTPAPSNSDPWAYLADLANYVIGSGEEPLKTTHGRVFQNRASDLLGKDVANKLLDSMYIYSKRDDAKSKSPTERLNLYYNNLYSGDKDIEGFKNKVKTLGYGVSQFFRDSPDVDTQALLNTPSVPHFASSKNDLVRLADLSNYVIASGQNPLDTKQGRILRDRNMTLPGSNADSRKLLDSLYLFNQRDDVKNLSPEGRLNLYYNNLYSGDKDIQGFKDKVKTLGYGVTPFFEHSPDIDIQTLVRGQIPPTAPVVVKQYGGDSNNSGLYPYGMINPFDRDPSTFTKGVYGASATPAVAPPAPPSFSDTGLYPYGVINPFDMDPYLLSTKENGTNSSAQAASKTAASNTGSKPPPDTKYKWGTNIGAATKLVGGLSAFNSILESNNRNRYKDQERIYNLGDNKGPLWPADWEERRGDYTVNGSFFRPDRMYPTQFGVAQMGGTLFSEPVQDVAVTGTPQLPVLPMPVAAPPVRPEPRGSFQNVEMPSIKVNERVKPNKATWDAFNYYVTEKGLEPLAAAAIVGNLYRESGLQPDVNEKGHTGNGRGIAQWDVRDRWKGLNKWAQQQGRDPYDLYTQLDYVLAEPGEGEKALKALEEARTPEEAAYVFGKVYERPLDKKHLAITKNPARWDIRAGIARQMFDSYMAQMGNRDGADLSQVSQMGSADGEDSQGMARGGEFRYQQGGEYVVTPEQLQRILANGGEVEYL